MLNYDTILADAFFIKFPFVVCHSQQPHSFLSRANPHNGRVEIEESIEFKSNKCSDLGVAARRHFFPFPSKANNCSVHGALHEKDGKCHAMESHYTNGLHIM